MIALSPREEWDYVLQDERNAAAPTTFRLRPLPLRDRCEVEDIAWTRDRDKLPGGTWSITIVRAGLVGWRDLHDAKGVEVRFIGDRNGRPTDETLERLPSAVCMELAIEIVTRSQLSEGDRKN